MMAQETNISLTDIFNESISFVLYTSTYLLYRHKEQEKQLNNIKNRRK